MPDTVSCSHILLMYDGSERSSSDRSKDDAEKQITDLKAQLDASADFAGLASEHSDCPSGQSGGELGTFGPNQMVKEFEEVAFALDVGETSGVVETEFGFHLIRRTG